jgi:hypothetical protein
LIKECNKTFPTAKGMTTHAKIFHYKYACSSGGTCAEIFASVSDRSARSSRDRHVRTKHAPEKDKKLKRQRIFNKNAQTARRVQENTEFPCGIVRPSGSSGGGKSVRADSPYNLHWILCTERRERDYAMFTKTKIRLLNIGVELKDIKRIRGVDVNEKKNAAGCPDAAVNLAKHKVVMYNFHRVFLPLAMEAFENDNAPKLILFYEDDCDFTLGSNHATMVSLRSLSSHPSVLK